MRTKLRTAAFCLLPLMAGVAMVQSVEPATKEEQIARLEKELVADRKALADYEERLADPPAEYKSLAERVSGLRDEIHRAEEKLKGFAAAGRSEAAHSLVLHRESLAEQLVKTRKKLVPLSRQRTELAEAVKRLREKIARDEQALQTLLGHKPPEAKKEEAPPSGPKPATEPQPPKTPAAAAALNPAAAAASAGAEPAAIPKRESEALRRAKEGLKEKQEQLDKTSKEVQALEAEIQAKEEDLKLRRSQEEFHTKALTAALKAREGLAGRVAALKASSPDSPELARLVTQDDRLREEARRHEASKAEAGARIPVLIAELKAKRLALQAAEERQRASEAAVAERKLQAEKLENPFAWENIREWFVNGHIRNVLLIICMIFVLRYVTRTLSWRVARLIAMNHRGMRTGEQDRQNRLNTLAEVFRSTVGLLIIVGGVLMVLDELGIPIVPLLGGAAILGLAVAFGAQNLIKDYFAGFMVLMEDQYGINDIVRIGDISGQVQNITLRMTVLRDIEGIVHFIPHGQINVVSNMTHGWSRAMLDVGVAYKENTDRVCEILTKLAQELRYDKKFGPLILEDAEILGVEKFDSSSVVIRFFIKTCPLQQWAVRREMLRRIKKKFDQLGIEIPFPHRTVYHRYEGEANDGHEPRADTVRAFPEPPVRKLG